MIVIFQCYGGTHTSIAAAAIYTGLLKRSSAPSSKELKELPYFDRLGKGGIGNLHFIGSDKVGSPVFALGSKNHGEAIRALLAQFIKNITPQAPPVAIIDCMSSVTPGIRLGGILSRRFQVSLIGRPLVNYAICCSFTKILQRVESFENNPRDYIIN